MRAIVNTEPGKLELQERPAPQPGRGQVRIATAACGICATDLVMIAGWERTHCPAIPGHEWSGVVDAVGEGVDGQWLGKRVVGENVLSDGGEVGFEHPGGYAERFLTEADRLHPLPDDLPLELAALIEPLAVSVRGFKRLGEDAAGPALILGDGPVGLIFARLLGDRERKPSLVGGREERLQAARKLGATKTWNYHTCESEFEPAVREQLGPEFPTIVEASGSSAALAAAMDLVAECGRILVLGDYGQDRAEFRWNHLLWRQIRLIGSNASADAWPEAVALAAGDRDLLETLITHRLPAEAFAEAVRLAKDRRSGAIKVVLQWASDPC